MKKFLNSINNQFLDLNPKLVTVGALFSEHYYFFMKFDYQPDFSSMFTIEEAASFYTDFEELKENFNGFATMLPMVW